ncbi:MFS general substrate transporter [Karstenula rhodostoma CBS 690.94]|uniref:MFS general substrate transporter n=1 Tax=Karstenula rhodostoma CBS 690.94 TaxID=1392251 RepID=A0A9P4PR25_9PLEO|nr:MFS general substrate transporter [Karstenula rhodostoma CBS 690.94]
MPLNPKDEPFPWKQLVIVGICRFSEPLAFNSILAYSYVMVKDLGIHEKDASFYSGLLLSAYAVAEAITALGWGAISDVYGRKPVALIGLAGVALSSLAFGFAKTYWVALLARFVGGALNGNVAIMQTMVQEMVKNPAHEPKAYATQPFVWTLGGIIGSAMGGFLAQPAKYYPGTFSEDGVFGRYPYLLPNLVAALGIVLAIIQGIFFLEETLPMQEDIEEETTQAALFDPTINERAPLLSNAHSTLPRDAGRPRDRSSISRASVTRASRSRAFSNSSFRNRSMSIVDGLRQIRKKPSFLEDGMPSAIDQRFDIRRDSFGTMHNIRMAHHEVLPAPITRPNPTGPKKTFNHTVVMLTLALTIIAFHQMAYITNLPVYLLDESTKDGIDFTGGLGLDLHDVGTFLAVNGLIALFTQGVIFPFVVEKVGVWNTFISMIILYPTTYVIVPFISALPEKLVSPGVYLSLFLQGLFGILVFPCALILLKNATPSPLVLGRVNGAAMSACCLARTVSSPLVGVVYSAGGSAAAWFFLAGCAVVGALQLLWVPNEHVDSVKVENIVKDAVQEAIHPHHVHISDTDSVAVADYED